MGILRKFIGAKSKYIKELPYTYEARVQYLDGAEDYNSYVGDTICSVIKHLKELEIPPAEARIFEVYSGKDEESEELDVAKYTIDGRWMTHDELCIQFCKEEYEGHVVKIDDCSFSDRDKICK